MEDYAGKTYVITAETISVLTHGALCTIPTTWGKRSLDNLWNVLLQLSVERNMGRTSGV